MIGSFGGPAGGIGASSFPNPNMRIVGYNRLSTAATTMTVSGINDAWTKIFFIWGRIANNAAAMSDISLYCNGDTTATNYRVQKTKAFGAAITTAAANDAIIGDVVNWSALLFHGFIHIGPGIQVRGHINVYSDGAGTAYPQIYTTHWKCEVSAALSSLTLSSSNANGIDANSFFGVYELVIA